jgi:hypothetical protein
MERAQIVVEGVGKRLGVPALYKGGNVMRQPDYQSFQSWW